MIWLRYGRFMKERWLQGAKAISHGLQVLRLIDGGVMNKHIGLVV